MRSATEKARRWFSWMNIPASPREQTELARLIRNDRRAMARLAQDRGRERGDELSGAGMAYAIQQAILALDTPPKRRTR